MMISSKTRRRRGGAGTLLVLAVLSMAGCAAQSAPATRYTLPETAGHAPGVTATSQQRQLAVSPVEVASYLDQEGIVMQTSDIELTAANQNLWAEELGPQLTRRLRQTLADALPGMTVLSAAQSDVGAPRLTVNVEQFQGRYDGQAVASGEWQLHEGNGLVAQHHFEVIQPLSDDGYPALVRTLGAVWQDVAQQVATGIRSTSVNSDPAN